MKSLPHTLCFGSAQELKEAKMLLSEPKSDDRASSLPLSNTNDTGNESVSPKIVENEPDLDGNTPQKYTPNDPTTLGSLFIEEQSSFDSPAPNWSGEVHVEKKKTAGDHQSSNDEIQVDVVEKVVSSIGFPNSDNVATTAARKGDPDVHAGEETQDDFIMKNDSNRIADFGGNKKDNEAKTVEKVTENEIDQNEITIGHDGKTEDSNAAIISETSLPSNLQKSSNLSPQFQDKIPPKTTADTSKVSEIGTRINEIVQDPTTEQLNPIIKSLKRKLQKVDDPSAFKITRQRRKVPKKVVDKVWEPPGVDVMSDIEKIFKMCVNQAIQKYGTSSKLREPSKKMVEAQNILSEAWLSNSNPNSFLARLQVTNIPVISRAGASGESGIDGDMLSIDKLLRRKKVIEAHLLADIKQLNELKKNVINLETVYQLDQKYLAELRKASQKIRDRMSRQSVEIRSRNGVVSDSNGYDKSIRLRRLQTGFDPNADPDTRMMLSSLLQLLQRLKTESEPMEVLNRKLEGLIRKMT